MHLPALIQDLAFMLMTAALTTIVFRWLKQPLVLGYLFAGFLVSPNFTLAPSIVDLQSIQVWAEIGVIFLLFSLGLEFSFKKLFQVGKTAVLTAVFEVGLMLTLGFFVGRAIGLNKTESMFLGAMLAISSTAVIVRTIEELKLKGRRFVSIVLGVLVVEDLLAMLLLVILSALAVTQTIDESAVLFTALRLAFFLVLWFVLGIYLVPQFLHRTRSYLGDETLLVVSLGLCLMMVYLATQSGFSPALGAFIMGSLLSETREGHRIEMLLLSVRNLFSAVFFVSVGMLINPQIIYKHWEWILLLSFVVIVGKTIFASLGALISGQNIRHSMQAGMSLTQVGEFSFIIATMGVSLKVIDASLYPVIVAVSAVTTFVTPHWIKLSFPLSKYLESKLPEKVKDRFDQYQLTVRNRLGEGPVYLVFKAYGAKWTLNAVILIGLAIGMKAFVLPQLQDLIGVRKGASAILLVVTLLMAAPFFWAIVLGQPRKNFTEDQLESLRKLQVGTLLIRFTLAFVLFIFIVSRFSSLKATSGVLLVFIAVITALFSRVAEPLYRYFEERFLLNLTQKERDAAKKARPTLAPWDAILTEFELSQYSDLVGKTLIESALKEKYGVTLALIERGTRRILAPGRDVILFPEDKLYFIGTDEQLSILRAVVEKDSPDENFDETDSYGLEPLIIDDHSPFIGKSIRECGIREAVQGLIVGIERNGERILNPDSALSIKARDLVWIVGNQSLVRNLQND